MFLMSCNRLCFYCLQIIFMDFVAFRYFNCPSNYGIFVPLAKVSLSPLARKSRMSRAGSKESLTSIGTMGTLGSITSTNTSRLRMSAQVPLTTYSVIYSTYWTAPKLFNHINNFAFRVLFWLYICELVNIRFV